MRVEITNVSSFENKEEVIKVETELNAFESKLGVFPIIQKAPFELHLQNQENEKLLIHGETDVTVALECGRCLTEVPTRIHILIDREVPLVPSESEEEEEPTYLEGSELDVDKLVYDEILVNWPMKVLCREDCKGICKKCGVNLNFKTCTCDRTELDPRMAAIQDVFNQFKEV